MDFVQQKIFDLSEKVSALHVVTTENNSDIKEVKRILSNGLITKVNSNTDNIEKIYELVAKIEKGSACQAHTQEPEPTVDRRQSKWKSLPWWQKLGVITAGLAVIKIEYVIGLAKVIFDYILKLQA